MILPSLSGHVTVLRCCNLSRAVTNVGQSFAGALIIGKERVKMCRIPLQRTASNCKHAKLELCDVL